MRVSVKAILAYNRKFLLLKPLKMSGNINGWDIPGGTVQKGERLQDALIREVKEETGIEIYNPVYLNSVFLSGNATKYEIFMAAVYTDQVILSNEHSKYKWVGEKEFFNLTRVNLKKYLN